MNVIQVMEYENELVVAMMMVMVNGVLWVAIHGKGHQEVGGMYP